MGNWKWQKRPAQTADFFWIFTFLWDFSLICVVFLSKNYEILSKIVAICAIMISIYLYKYIFTAAKFGRGFQFTFDHSEIQFTFDHSEIQFTFDHSEISIYLRGEISIYLRPQRFNLPLTTVRFQFTFDEVRFQLPSTIEIQFTAVIFLARR